MLILTRDVRGPVLVQLGGEKSAQGSEPKSAGGEGTGKPLERRLSPNT